MSSEFFPLTTLKSLISHHIAILQRYELDSDKEFSLLFFDFGEYKEDIEIKKTIQTVFRDCDIIFEYNGDYIILLPKSSWQYSYNILKELKEFLNKDVIDSIVTFPEDGKNADELLDSFKKIVQQNHKIDLKI